MKIDTVTKDFVRDTEVFADIFNQYIYGGRQVILPGDLAERDTTGIALPYGEDGAAVPVQKFRDVRKLYAAMADGKASYVLYGIEAQSEIHYAMPARNGLYDMLDYAGQVEEAAKSHRRAMGEARKEARPEEPERKKPGREKPGRGEFLGGFWKEDRLVPCVTLTVYFGAGTWDGPLSLSEMMGPPPDPEVAACMNDYRMHLVAPARMEEEDIMKYRSGMREVMLFIKYSGDKKKLQEVLEANEVRFRNVERRAADVIEAVTKSGLNYREDEVTVDVCQAIQEMMQEEYQNGYQLGEQLGEQKGYQLGEQRGYQLGEQKGYQLGEQKGYQLGSRDAARKTARKLAMCGMDVDVIADVLEMDAGTVRKWLG